MRNINRTHFFVITIVAISVLIFAAFTIKAIYYRYDRDNFLDLDSQMKIIYSEIANNSELKWGYETNCSAERKGAWPTGRYNCHSTIFTGTGINSVNQINELNDKYYEIINNSSIFYSKNDLQYNPSDSFGKKIVVSSAEKEYAETKSNIECAYLFKVKNISDSLVDNTYGNNIDKDKVVVDISLSCTGIAKDYWYEISDKSELPNPEAPIKRD